MAAQTVFSVSGYSEGFSIETICHGLAIIVAFCLLRHFIAIYVKYQEDVAFGELNGCLPPPELTKRWPLGIDRIKELWQSNSEGRLLSFLCMVAKDFEPRNNLTQHLLFGPRAFHILDPKNVGSVLSTNFKGDGRQESLIQELKVDISVDYDFGARRSVFSPLLGNGIFTQEGPAWKHSRELLRKQFIRIRYQNLDLFREHVDNLIERLPTKGDVDLQLLFFSLTLDTTTALLFGKSVFSLRTNTDQTHENRLFAESFNLAQEGLVKRFRLAPWHFLYNPPEFRRACSNVHHFVESYIKKLNLLKSEVMEEAASHSFINQIAKESTNMKDIRDQLLNVLLAGRDTTACCLSWTLRLLVRHPIVMNRLHMEIDSVMVDSEHPTREQIRKMPYLACVIKESLRLYPPVPLNNRQATRTTMLPTGGGPDGHSPILVLKGEVVVFSQYVNSRKQNIYGPDADDFRPERWEGQKLANIGWACFPFNGGPRKCLGEDFALMQISYTLVRLLKCAVIKLPADEKVEPIGSEKQRLTLVLCWKYWGLKSLLIPI